MIMPIKYTDEQVAEAVAMRARGEKQAVIYLTFGAGIDGAIRRVRERDEGPALLLRMHAIGRQSLKRKADGQVYFVYQVSGRKIAGREAAYLVPKGAGHCHWKSHERILQDFTTLGGAAL